LENQSLENKPVLMEIGYDQGKFRGYSLAAFYGFIAAFAYLYAFGGELTEQKLWACLVMFLGLVPFMLYFWGENLGRIPLFPLLGFYHAMAFGMPGLFPGIGGVSPQVLLPALEASAFGLVALLLGYYGAGPRLFPNAERFHLAFQPRPEEVVPFAWMFLVTDQILEPIPRPWGILAFAQQVIPTFGWMARAILLVNFLRDGDLRKKSNFFLIFVALPYEFLWRFSSGALGQVMILGFMVGIIFINYRKSVPFRLVFMAAVFFLLMQPIKAEFRELTWNRTGPKMSLSEKADLYLKIAMDHYGKPDPVKKKGNPDAVERLGQVGLLAVVMNESPATVPFKLGATYNSLFYKWIPRLIWAGKPKEALGNDLGHWYGIIAPDDEDTAVNLPWLVEFYVNFGWPGIGLGMFLLGVWFYYLSRKLCDERQGLMEYGVSMSLVFAIWWAECNFSMMWGGIIISLVAYIFFFWFLKHSPWAAGASPKPGLPGNLAGKEGHLG